MKNIKDLWEDTRGNIGGVWITVAILIFTVVVVYALTYGLVCTTLYNLAVTMAPADTASGYFNVIGLVRMVYNVVPWIMIIGILLWGFLSSQREEYETGY